MADSVKLFMTPEESKRIQTTIHDHFQRCREQKNKPWETSDPGFLIQQATSASLMQDLSSAAFGLGTPKGKETMVAYAISRPYPPCMTRIQDLQSMNIQDLRVETHHRGKFLSLRRISPVVALESSSWAVVQGDSVDHVARIEVFLHKSQYGKDILDVCSELLVKEPFYTLSSRGEPTIRIDHPSDLVISKWCDHPESWRQRQRDDGDSSTNSPEKCKEKGNAALQKKDHLRAHAYYTEGLLAISEDKKDDSNLAKDLYRNRSHVNLILRRFDEARTDALCSITGGESAEQKQLDGKAYYRAGLAAYALGDFEDARGYFEAQEEKQPGSQHAQLNLRRIKLRLRETETGAYNFTRIVKTLSKNQGRPDVANFNGYTEVKSSPGAGRGLFATHTIEPNDIIMCERAFCVVWGYEPAAFSALTCDVRDAAAIRVFPAGLHKAVVEKLMSNPSQAGKVLDLYGDYAGTGKKPIECDGRPVIDTFQIHDIIQRNAFGPGQQTTDEDISNASTGLWIRASYVNHSCVPNAKRDYIGDLLILRATRHIAAGEEITQAYDASPDYKTRVKVLLDTWGFECKCAICLRERDTKQVTR